MFLTKIDTIHPIFSMIYLSISRGLPLGRLSIVIPKASTIWLRNSSDPIGFPGKATELLSWHNWFYLLTIYSIIYFLIFIFVKSISLMFSGTKKYRANFAQSIFLIVTILSK